MNCLSADNDEARRGGVEIGELRDPYLRAKVVTAVLAVLVGAQFCSQGQTLGLWIGELNSTTNNCLFCLSLQLMLNYTTRCISLDFLLRFALARFRLDTAGKSTRTFHRRSNEKKNPVLCLKLRSLRQPYLPVDWNQVWECLAIF